MYRRIGKLVFIAVAIALVNWAASAVAATEIIGREARIPFPENSRYLVYVNARPTDRQVVQFNPPVFSWTYDPDPSQSHNDSSIRSFRFQVAYDEQFTNVAVNVDTEVNFYNTLPPFTQDTCWWRVGYLDDQQPPQVQQWSAVRSFTIAPGAVEWDRSMLADEPYLASKAVHPRLFYNAGNLPAIRQWIQGDARATDRLNWLITRADQYITDPWWTSPGPYSEMNNQLVALRRVLVAWLLTEDPKYINARPQDVLLALGQVYLDNVHDRRDDTDGHAIRGLALGFDWLYNEMTQGERDQALVPLERNADWLMNYDIFRRPPGGSNVYNWLREHPEEPIVPEIVWSTSFYKIGHSHGIDNFNNGMYAAMAAWEHGPKSRHLFDVGVNYMLGKAYYMGSEDGYNNGSQYSASVFIEVINLAFLGTTIFPEAQFEINPHFKVADWWGWYSPVGLQWSFWGDNTWYLSWGSGAYVWRDFGEQLALLTGDGVAYRHWLNHHGGVIVDRNRNGYLYMDIVQPWYCPVPAQASEGTTGRVFPIDGWAAASAYPPSTTEAYTDGVGMVFKCGSRLNRDHANFNELAFQLWAYGECITHMSHDKNYNTSYATNLASHNSLLIDGLGQNQVVEYSHQWDEYFAKIIAFKEGQDYVYVAGDGTYAYPHQTFPVLRKHSYLIFTQRNASHLTKMRRHMLMMNKKYFIIFDEMVATQPSQFTWMYHVPYDSTAWNWPSPNEPRFSYTMGNVDVHLVHLGDPPSLDVMTWVEDEMLHTNPLTGEQFPDLYEMDPTKSMLTPPRKLWISNATLAETNTFLTVIYPVKAGDPVPTITRIDDLTVDVACGGDHDIVTFNPANKDMATLFVDLSQFRGRHIFYNNSSFDGNDPAAGAADDGAIAPGKAALLPGGTATFANYTSYSRGINGIMVDIEDLPGTPVAADFEFKVGNDSSPAAWPQAPAPSSITVRPGAGLAGADRVTIIWSDNAIANQWLAVTVKATANTGLPADEMFYFGNAIGETGNSPTDAKVSPTDVIGIRNNPHTLANDPAAIDDVCDFNRDQKVGPTDYVAARDNATNSQTALQLITVP